jgi:AcrR family transcriptional regulator
MADAKPKRRRYDSPLRRQRAAETRERIISAGVDLLHEFPVWNWRALTVRAVAKQAEVNERTVYRHFANERELREAVFARQQQDAGVDLQGLELEHLPDLTKRILEYVSTFPIEPRNVIDPTLREAGRRNREALLAAVTRASDGWPEADRTLVAALLDVLWSVASYERLVADWELDPKEATRGVTWLIRLVENAIRDGRGPGR